MITIPHASTDSVEFFRSIIPDDQRVAVRPMFGNLAGFVNGNMFMGLYGDDLFLRLSDDTSKELLKIKGASAFEPMPGRPMKGYFVIPRAWKRDQRTETVQSWVSKSLAWAGKLPPKVKKEKTVRTKTAKKIR